MEILKELYDDLLASGLKNSDEVMIHSSYKSLGVDVDGKIIVNTLKAFFKEGLLIFPTHTWASMKNDGMVMDKKAANSCVGYLTNVAILDMDFIRSNHPTHSVCAYGKDSKIYTSYDDNVTTPVSPSGCFGALKNKGKILFLGAPLSKNTFVHSIEEEANVPDRFTEHIYTFYTNSNDRLIEYHMPRHYNEKCPHISDNYEKLLPIMLEKGIAKSVKILASTSYIVDAKELRSLVLDILKKDIHAFDDNRSIKHTGNMSIDENE